MKQNTTQSSDVRRSGSSVQNDLFRAIPPTASSHISGGHWHSSYSTSFSTPPRHHSHGYGRRPSYSHQMAAQRLNQALFA